MPCSLIEAASSSRAVASKSCRGCNRLGRTRVTGTRCTISPGGAGTVATGAWVGAAEDTAVLAAETAPPKSAPNPRPKAGFAIGASMEGTSGNFKNKRNQRGARLRVCMKTFEPAGKGARRVGLVRSPATRMQAVSHLHAYALGSEVQGTRPWSPVSISASSFLRGASGRAQG